MVFVDLNRLQQINHQFHGCTVLQRRFVQWFIGVVWKTNQLHNIFVECWDSGSDHCPLGLETWQWTLKGQPPPRQLPLQPLVSLSSHSLGTTHPGCPLCLSFSPSPSLLLSLFPFLSFSLSPGSLYPAISRAPCVTRMIKTNTDLILVFNPIVLFFFSPALEHAEY